MCMWQADIAGEVYRSVCVGKELWRLWENDLKKKMNVRDGQNAEGGGEEGMCRCACTRESQCQLQRLEDCVGVRD